MVKVLTMKIESGPTAEVMEKKAELSAKDKQAFSFTLENGRAVKVVGTAEKDSSQDSYKIKGIISYFAGVAPVVRKCLAFYNPSPCNDKYCNEIYALIPQSPA